MKTLQVQVHFNKDLMKNKEQIYVNFNVFSVIKTDFEHAFICWWVALFVRAS